ncbi:reverse transcriptase domain-containing protein [Tanacetum coccineum]
MGRRCRVVCIATRSSLEYTIQRRRNCRRSSTPTRGQSLSFWSIPYGDDIDLSGAELLLRLPPGGDDLVSKFINFFFPPSKTTNLRNEITNFRQIAQESFSEAWERFKELLRKCPHHAADADGNFLTNVHSKDYKYRDIRQSATEHQRHPPLVYPQNPHDPVKPVGSPISPEPSSAQVDNSPLSKEPSKETKLPYPSRVEHEKKGENDKPSCIAIYPDDLRTSKLLSLCVLKDIDRDVLSRPFLRTARVLIDVHGEELVIRDDVCEPKNDDSTTSTIVDEFESLLEKIIKQKEEVKGISDPAARRKACFKIINQGRVIHSPKKASISAISHIFPNNNLEDSFKMGDEDLNFIPNKELDKEISFQSHEEVHKETLKSHLNPLFEKDEEIISNEASRQISPKVDVKTIVSFFAPIGNCVRKWATSEFVKDNDEFNHEVFKSDNENDLGIHDNKKEEIAFLDGLLEDENFFETK